MQVGGHSCASYFPVLMATLFPVQRLVMTGGVGGALYGYDLDAIKLPASERYGFVRTNSDCKDAPPNSQCGSQCKACAKSGAKVCTWATESDDYALLKVPGQAGIHAQDLETTAGNPAVRESVLSFFFYLPLFKFLSCLAIYILLAQCYLHAHIRLRTHAHTCVGWATMQYDKGARRSTWRCKAALRSRRMCVSCVKIALRRLRGYIYVHSRQKHSHIIFSQVYSHTSLGKEVAKKFLIIVGYILTGM